LTSSRSTPGMTNGPTSKCLIKMATSSLLTIS
jgi:hypothetical protein